MLRLAARCPWPNVSGAKHKTALPQSDSRSTAAEPRWRATNGNPTGLLLSTTRIFDIDNAEAFVQRTIDAAGISYTPDEREELLAEGLVILLELARRYKPLPPHGRFSGYAAMFLPRRLGDAWHRWHPEHRYITDPATGRRRWHYDRPAISLDGILDCRNDDGERSGGDVQLARARTVRDFVPQPNYATGAAA